MNFLFQPVQSVVRGAVRAALRQGALIGAALLASILGVGFLIFAGYLGLRFLLGPGGAATVMGAVLLALAAGLLMIGNRAGRTVQPNVLAPARQTPSQATAPRPGDAAAMAVFSAAFLLGRRLADQWASSRNT